MPLRSPDLDDRRFEDLIAEAWRRIAEICPAWTDHSPSDPGGALLDVFAYLTEIMIYRLNRIPDKAYVEFLRLIGVKLHAPSAARAILRFTFSQKQDHPVEIPRGTRVTTERSDAGTEPVIFSTAETVAIEVGDTDVEVPAYHCELVQSELAGIGSGLPGQSVTVNRPPIVAPNRDGFDLVVGVEAEASELNIQTPALRLGSKVYRIWREVDNFTNLANERHVYVVDRLSGVITFAPALRQEEEPGLLEEEPTMLANPPPAGREIRLSYRQGGGIEGNVAAHTLTVLKDSIAGVQVTNPGPAQGGRSAETLQNALVRGPQALHSLQRAVTAGDFELLAVHSSGAVERAKAFTRASLWAHAIPGTVEILLVPHIPEKQRKEGKIPLGILTENESESVRTKILTDLERKRPIGTTCLVNWARYKPVQVKARVIVHREENPVAVKSRILSRLYNTINPLPSGPDVPGWPFGKPLTAWDVYKMIGAEAGVNSVSQVKLLVEDVPDKAVSSLAADAFQEHTWYAGAGDKVFRSMNDGGSWEAIAHFSGQQVDLVRPYPREYVTKQERAGLLAVATRKLEGGSGSRLHFSRDCGETWESGTQTKFRIEDMAWLERDGVPSLLLATEAGLYGLEASTGAVPIQVLVDPTNQSLGFYSIAVSSDAWGVASVSVAARGEQGVYLSSHGGQPDTFKQIGLKRELVRVLSVQHLGPHRYLWAGIASAGKDPGKGCFRWRLTGSADTPEGWRPFHTNWHAGSCRSLAFQGSRVFASSLLHGVLRLDTEQREPRWETPNVECGLPLRDIGRLQPVDTVASNPEGELLMAAGSKGVYCSQDQGVQYKHYSSSEFSDEVTLPKNWLFCSGDHELNVESEDET